MTHKIAALALLLALTLAGCTSDPHIQPGEGPAEPATSAPAEGEPMEGEPGDPPKPATVPSFKQKYVYDDGVEVEVVRIDKGKMTRKDIENEFNDKLKVGTDWVRFTGRIRNGSKEIIDSEFVSVTTTYGRDGQNAEQLTFNDDADFEGKILPGRAKTAEATFAIPAKYWDDVVYEIGLSDDYSREPVIFVGSVR